jgi:hypothetical protein
VRAGQGIDVGRGVGPGEDAEPDASADHHSGAGGLVGDEAVPGESVVLCSIGVGGLVMDGGGTRQFAELVLTARPDTKPRRSSRAHSNRVGKPARVSSAIS